MPILPARTIPAGSAERSSDALGVHAPMMAREAAMREGMIVQCARCKVPRRKRACDIPGGAAPHGCPTLLGGEAVAVAVARYSEPAVRKLAYHASCQEATAYDRTGRSPRPRLTRVEETIAFANRMGFKRLGVAFCAGLSREAEMLDQVLAARGFEVVSVVCKVGAVPKESLGLADGDKIRPGGFESMCNPLSQAELLNRAGTELNIMLGLCVGHDTLFLRAAAAPCTVLAVKDRLLGHNPMAALYTAGSYYRSIAEAEDRPPAGDGS
jgi:uncharacterized metal-binding protein